MELRINLPIVTIVSIALVLALGYLWMSGGVPDVDTASQIPLRATALVTGGVIAVVAIRAALLWVLDPT